MPLLGLFSRRLRGNLFPLSYHHHLVNCLNNQTPCCDVYSFLVVFCGLTQQIHGASVTLSVHTRKSFKTEKKQYCICMGSWSESIHEMAGPMHESQKWSCGVNFNHEHSEQTAVSWPRLNSDPPPVVGWLVGWSLTALSAQIGHIVP